MKGILGMEGSYDCKVDRLVWFSFIMVSFFRSRVDRGILGSVDVLFSVCDFFG